MCMVLKTFKLSKKPLVHLFYLILIVSTVENIVVEKPASYTPAPTEENINNVDEGSTINIKDQQQSNYKNPFSNILQNLGRIPKKFGGLEPLEEEIDTDTLQSDENIESTINIEDQQQNDDENPFSNMLLDQSPESTTNGGLEPLEEEMDIDHLPPDENEETTSNGGIKEEEKKKVINELVKRLNAGHNINPTNTNEINNIGTNADNDIEDQQQGDDENPFSNTILGLTLSEESTSNRSLVPLEEEIDTDTLQSDENKESTINIEDQQQDDDENPFSNMMLDPSPESTTLGDLDPEEMKETENDQNTEDEITNSKKKKKKKKKKERKKSKIIPDSEDDNMLHSLKSIDSKDLIVSSLENVDIIKIKGENPESEAIRKEKKKYKFEGFKPRQENARIYCTFLGNVLKMYKKVRKRFVGQFCHAIVIGTPIILKNYRVHLSEKMKDQLQTIYPEKDQSLLIVIMQYQKYRYWVQALRHIKSMKKLITDIIHTVVNYKIDGIQFSNLHPIEKTDQVNKQMMNHLVHFFENLQIAAAKAKKYDLKIGITIDMHGLSITKSFSSFKNLNLLVTWYSFKTISMVQCKSKYETSDTSPLEGFKTTINTLIGTIHEEFDMTKLVVGIQLFPNKINDLRPYTYEELCSSPKDTWHDWCFMNPEDLRLKGRFLRGAQIGGVQLYYMHSDDYRSTCGCYSFPLIRALLRGLIKFKTPETCDFRIAHN